MSATYTKLKSGEWGIRCTERVKAGQRVTVSTKAGKEQSEVVNKVVWQNDDLWICSIEEKDKHGPTISKYCESPGECEEALACDAPDRLCFKCSKWYDKMMGE